MTLDVATCGRRSTLLTGGSARFGCETGTAAAAAPTRLLFVVLAVATGERRCAGESVIRTNNNLLLTIWSQVSAGDEHHGCLYVCRLSLEVFVWKSVCCQWNCGAEPLAVY